MVQVGCAGWGGDEEEEEAEYHEEAIALLEEADMGKRLTDRLVA